MFLGDYIEVEDAARRYDLVALHRRDLNATTNFQVSDYLDAAGEQVPEPPQDGATTLGGEPLTSKYNGVCWNRRDQKWQANIQIGSKLVYLGYHTGEEAAACVRDLATPRFHGLGAELNFPVCEYTDAGGEVVYPPHLNRWMFKVDEAMAACTIVSMKVICSFSLN